MGSWGTGLYQSDTGLDVRATYRECKKFGFRGEELAAVVRDTLGLGPTPESEDDILAYLALADLLWKDGMLPKDLRETALRLIKTPVLTGTLGRPEVATRAAGRSSTSWRRNWPCPSAPRPRRPSRPISSNAISRPARSWPIPTPREPGPCCG